MNMKPILHNYSLTFGKIGMGIHGDAYLPVPPSSSLIWIDLLNKFYDLDQF